MNLDITYMDFALKMALNSKAIRAKVGAVLVTKHGVVLTGYNGTPSGTDNSCEMFDSNGNYVTKPEVLHAELNCIMKAAREGVSCIDATVYVTLSPCVQCAAMMKQVGIKRVVYLMEYRDNTGIEYLKNNGVKIERQYL